MASTLSRWDSMPGGPSFQLHLECDFASVRRAASRIRRYLEARNLSEKEIWACELAFVEGCNNAVQHTPRSEAFKKIQVDLIFHEQHLELRINDHTRGFDLPETSSLPDAETERGRGIYLMRSLMDEVEYVRDASSNCLILKKDLTGI